MVRQPHKDTKDSYAMSNLGMWSGRAKDILMGMSKQAKEIHKTMLMDQLANMAQQMGMNAKTGAPKGPLCLNVPFKLGKIGKGKAKK